MIYIKDEIKKMKEKDLREKVLLPLFEKMGFQNVNHYHGINERGKDIIMWKNDELGARNYYAIVVKACKINGKASGKGSAGEVNTQVRQSFSQQFKDKIDGKDKSVDVVWIVCNNIITKESIDTISDDNKSRIIRYIDIDELYKLYQKYLPDNPTDKILTASSQLDSISPNWGVGIQKAGNIVFFYPEPKHDYANEIEPLKFTLTFKSNLEIDGIPIQDILTNPELITKPIYFSKEMIIKAEASEFLTKAMNFGNFDKGISIIPLKIPQKEIIVKFIDYQSNEYIIEGIELHLESEIENERIFSNINQDITHHITITILELENKREITINVNVKKGGYPVDVILNGFRFLNAMALGGFLCIIDKSSNKTIIKHNVEPNSNNLQKKSYIEFLECLNFIQLKTNKKIIIPKRDITKDEVYKVKKIALLLRGNLLYNEDFEWWKIEVDIDKAKEILEQIDKNGSIQYYDFYESDDEDIFDTIINLGSVHYYCDAATLYEEDKQEITNQIKNRNEKIKIVLRPFKKSLIFTFYENYLENGKEITEEKIRKLLENFPYKYKEES